MAGFLPAFLVSHQLMSGGSNNNATGVRKITIPVKPVNANIAGPALATSRKRSQDKSNREQKNNSIPSPRIPLSQKTAVGRKKIQSNIAIRRSGKYFKESKNSQ